MSVPSFKWLFAALVVLFLVMNNLLQSFFFVTADGTPMNKSPFATCPYCGTRGNYDPHNKYYRCVGCGRTFVTE
jgi:DNA-directed RNA polymerase subunit RPC12/RpoP